VAKNSNRLAVAGAAGLFVAIVAAIITLRLTKVITYELTMLMLVALLGLYVGFGILIGVYRLLNRLQ